MAKKNRKNNPSTDGEPHLVLPGQKHGFAHRMRNYFLTGLVVAAPIAITVYLSIWFVDMVDRWFKPLIPARYDPDQYLPFTVPGLGVLMALVMLTILGALTANFFGRTIINFGEGLVARMPVVRNVYHALKQIFETVLAQSNTSFQEVGLIEYPRKGLHAIVFVTTKTKGEIDHKIDGELVSVFLPTTPNPTSGFLLFVPREDIKILDMTVEEAAKLVISAGLVAPEFGAESSTTDDEKVAALKPATDAAQ